MDIQSFGQSLTPDQRREFVENAGTNTAYFSQLVIGHRKAGTDLAREMVRASKELFPDDQSRWLTLEGIRPDIWGSVEAA